MKIFSYGPRSLEYLSKGDQQAHYDLITFITFIIVIYDWLFR